jgi:hypothetical protein
MSRRRFRMWHKLVAFVPPLLLTVALPSEALLRCQMDGLLRSACCCPADKAPPSSLPVLKTQACCEREVTVNQRSAVEPGRERGRRAAEDFVGVAVAALTSSMPLAADSGANRVAAHSHGPPRDGPSLVVLKHAFLI